MKILLEFEAKKVVGSLVGLIEQLLTVSKLKEGGKAVLLTGPVYDMDLIGKYLQALNNVGADFVHVVAPPAAAKGGERGSLGERATATLRDSTVWDVLKGPKLVLYVTSLQPSWAGFPQRWIGAKVPDLYTGTGPGSMYDLLCSGTRWLNINVSNPEVNMRRFFPTETVIRRGYNGAKLLEKAKTIRITSEAGTDLTADITGCKGNANVGVAEVPQKWDNYGVHQVSCAPKQDSANGTLVITPGSYMPHMGAYCDFYETVKLTFKDGYITKIEGGGHAKILERWLNRTGEKEAKAFSGHVGWGINVENMVWRHDANWSIYDYESAPFLVHFGHNNSASPAPYNSFNGQNAAKSHGGPSCSDIDLYLDDEPIVKNSVLVHPKCR